MKNTKAIKHLTLRTLIVATSLIGVSALMSFKPIEFSRVEKGNSTNRVESVNGSKEDQKAKFVAEPRLYDITKLSIDPQYSLQNKEYVLREDQVKSLPHYILNSLDRRNNLAGIKGSIIGVETNETETLVDVVYRPLNDIWWFFITEHSYLRDRSTGDRYKIRGIEGVVPLGTKLVVLGHQNRYICATLIFPPLDKGVKKFDFIKLDSETPVTTADRTLGPPTSEYKLDVKKLKKIKSQSYKIIE